MILSVLMPLNSYKINIAFPERQKVSNISAEKITEELTSAETPQIINNVAIVNNVMPKITDSSFDWKDYLIMLYLIIALILIVRIIIQLFVIAIQYFKSDRLKTDGVVILRNSRFKNSFSFFNLIFLTTYSSSEDEIDSILSHEKIHARQYHSIDLIMIELLAAVMWFNPLVWMMRNSLQLVHEYLADEGALSTGIDKLRYQALLINQVTEERLICLSSSFNHSLIKKRMIMMTKSKINQQAKLKILALIPLVAILFFGIACVNGQKKTESFAAIAPTKMNVLYLGANNPMTIAAPGYEASELTVSIDNGTIEGKDGFYEIHPKKVGAALVTVSCKDKVIQEAQFRVKRVPDPIAAVSLKEGDFKWNGTISKTALIEAQGVVAFMQNFDFDISFEIVEFTVSTQTEGFIKEAQSLSNKFTEEQKKIMLSDKIPIRVIIEDIKCKGPDGFIRSLSPIILIVE
jgi:hypothetical protein